MSAPVAKPDAANDSTPNSAEELRGLYRHRFDGKQAYRDEVWRTILGSRLQNWVGANKTVLDLGCGWGEFSRNVQAAKLYSMDLNPDSQSHLPADAIFMQQDCSQDWGLPEQSLDVVFTSNFLEHLPNKDALMTTLLQARQTLKPGGKLICLGPNIAYLPGKYWDFWDHHIALSHNSLVEALNLAGFKAERVIPRFLPYTMSNGPKIPRAFIKLYLSLPLLWPLFGKQFLVVASAEAESVSETTE